MANMIHEKLNSYLSASSDIISFYTRSYLCSDDRLHIGATREISDIDLHYQLNGYELNRDRTDNINALNSITSQILGLSAQRRLPVMLTYINDSEHFTVYISSCHEITGSIRNSIADTLSNVQLTNRFITTTEASALQSYNNYLTGTFAPADDAFDGVIEAYRRDKWMINLLISPLSPGIVTQEIETLGQHISSLHQANENSATLAGRQTTIRNSSLEKAIRTLEEIRDQLYSSVTDGLWETVIHVSSDDQSTADNLSAALSGALSQNTDTSSQFHNCVTHSAVALLKNNRIQLPTFYMGHHPLNNGIFSHSLLNPLDRRSLLALLCLPHESHHGFRVSDHSKEKQAHGKFDNYSNEATDRFELGQISETETFYLGINELRRHVFITGATQSGKSTTVRKILSKIKGKVPFIVIEAARKDYWDKISMYQGMHDVKVYSAGKDALDLKLNPFVPEAYTTIQTHIDNLMSVFMTMMEDEGPIEAILRQLLISTYEKKGLNRNTRIDPGHSYDYPCLQDMSDLVDECIDRIGYDQEIAQRMKGVMNIRISSLIDAGGNALVSKEAISTAELLKTSSIVELDDFRGSSKAFAASLLAIKFQEYSSQMNTSVSLDRLLVIEEAHHLLMNPELKQATRPMTLVSNFFADMLAELSGYGSGIMVIDQRPSIISRAALANTSTKITHRLNEGSDVRMMCESLSLNDGSYIQELSVGQAIVRSCDSISNVRLHVDRASGIKERNVACLFGWQLNDSVAKLIGSHEKSLLQSDVPSANLLDSCIRSIEDRELRKFSSKEKAVLAGELLSMCNISDLNKRRVMYCYDYRLRH